MGDYFKQPPEPGRPISKQIETRVEKTIIEQKIDTNAIAEAVIKAIGSKLSINSAKDSNNVYNEEVNINSLGKLAEAMIVDRGNKEGKLEDIGSVKNVKKTDDNTSATVDLLKNLED